MATETDRTSMRKVTVTLPASLLTRLDERVPSRRRSAFIARAIQEQLAILEQAAAIEESAGAWRDEDYPEMATDEDIDRWLIELRGATDERLAQLLHLAEGTEG
jgi:Arc/MetJ-type ribon-helix-helix transcriptional regulator